MTIKDAERGEHGDYQSVLALIRSRLLSGEFKVGDRLPGERELAKELAVGRPIVREALRSLEMMGAVQIKHGSGTYVATPSSHVLRDLFAFLIASQQDAFDDIMEARIAIEFHAVRLACTRSTQSDIDAFSRCMTRIEATIADPVEGARADFDFHTCIVKASRSASLNAIYEAISQVLYQSHFSRRAQILEVEGIDGYLIDHHRQIFRALVERDADKAASLLAEHFQIGADFMRRSVLVSASGERRR